MPLTKSERKALREFADLIEAARAGTLPQLKHPTPGHSIIETNRFVSLSGDRMLWIMRGIAVMCRADEDDSPNLAEARSCLAIERHVLRSLIEQWTPAGDQISAEPIPTPHTAPSPAPESEQQSLF